VVVDSNHNWAAEGDTVRAEHSNRHTVMGEVVRVGQVAVEGHHGGEDVQGAGGEEDNGLGVHAAEGGDSRETGDPAVVVAQVGNRSLRLEKLRSCWYVDREAVDGLDLSRATARAAADSSGTSPEYRAVSRWRPWVAG
jgi:hypothetical protein